MKIAPAIKEQILAARAGGKATCWTRQRYKELPLSAAIVNWSFCWKRTGAPTLTLFCTGKAEKQIVFSCIFNTLPKQALLIISRRANMYMPKGAQTHFKEDTDMAKAIWSKGTIDEAGARYEYWAKHYGQGSEYGIGGGRISKLVIRKAGESKDLYSYDRGLDVDCQSDDVRRVLESILAKYN
jgi:hypothetical protein